MTKTELKLLERIFAEEISGSILQSKDKRYKVLEQHSLLHMRKRKLKACGHADWLKCRYCLQYDDPKNMVVCKNKKGLQINRVTAYHESCQKIAGHDKRVKQHQAI